MYKNIYRFNGLKPFLQEGIWPMDMIHGSAGNFCAHFMKNVDLYVQGDRCVRHE